MSKSAASGWNWSGWKKKLPASVKARRAMIETNHPTLSIRRQCELVGLSRATYYYQPASDSPLNLLLMRLIDEQYLRTPFFGYRKMTVHLRELPTAGLAIPLVNHKRVIGLMQRMGLQAVYPRPRTSIPAAGHKKYPYLLRGLTILRPNQVWGADITYIPMRQGFMYLVAIMDWFSRFVLAWQLSNTLDGAFCLDALHLALQLGRPDIFNTDQGAQFTAEAFTGHLQTTGIRISMAGRGRAFDNIFVERLWRSVKYEDVYLKEYDTVLALAAGLDCYFHFYNYRRPHQSLQYRSPAQVHFDC
jgi:putative transposase